MSKKKQQSFDNDEAMFANARKLREVLESIEVHGDGEHPSTISDVARISVALTSACAEIRQSMKASTRQLESYPISDLVARLKQLSDEERKEVARDISGETEEESLL